MMNRTWLLGAVLAVLAAAGVMLLLRNGDAVANGTTQVDLADGVERDELETVIREYILANPEIIPEAMQVLQQRNMLQAVSSVREDIETPFEGAWAGNPNGDVTVVEFFDYACGYCRQMVGNVERLIEEDDGVRVVFRELPILSQESADAARVSLSAARQRDFMAFHTTLYRSGRLSDATIAQARNAAGLDAAEVRRDIADEALDAELQKNLSLAQQLGFTGTPTFVIGNEIIEGAVGYEALVQAVERARAARGA